MSMSNEAYGISYWYGCIQKNILWNQFGITWNRFPLQNNSKQTGIVG